MLRATSTAALRLLIILAAIGLLIAREWGWREYASPELYLIHWQQVGPRGQWLIIPAGGGTNRPLLLNGEPIPALDCSPDGRTLALLDSTRTLHVIGGGGVRFARAVDPAFASLTVANDGLVALYRPGVGGERVAAKTSEPITTPPDAASNYRVAVGAGGWQMWNSDVNMVQFVNPSGALVQSIFPVSAGRWLADEHSVTFGTLGDDQRQYLLDAARPSLVALHQAPGVFAPDGLTRAVALRDEQHGSYRTYIGGAFGNEHLRPVPREDGASDWPQCFVTFWPVMVAE